MTTYPVPLEIKCLQKKRKVIVTYETGKYELSCEYLRSCSPAADARAESNIDKTKRKQVNIIEIETVGEYAVKFIFDDGHNTGIYSWELLYQLALNSDKPI